jgi:hypothetical protein
MREIEFHLMHGRNDSIIYYDTKIDLTKTLAFLEEYNKGKEKKEQLTLFMIFLAACCRMIAHRYKINRFVSGRRLWQRNQILFSFIVKKELTEEGEETVATIEFDPFDTIKTVQEKVYKRIYRARHGDQKIEKDVNFFAKMPRFAIRLLFAFGAWLDRINMPIYALTSKLPMFCSIFIANLGSIGLESIYHHLYEIGNASVFFNYGIMHRAPVVNQETDEIEVKTIVDLRVSIDDRIAGGAYTGPSVHLLRDLFENPERLVNPPELTNEQLDKLKLKKYKKEWRAREKERKKLRRKNKRKKKKK